MYFQKIKLLIPISMIVSDGEISVIATDKISGSIISKTAIPQKLFFNYRIGDSINKYFNFEITGDKFKNQPKYLIKEMGLIININHKLFNDPLSLFEYISQQPHSSEFMIQQFIVTRTKKASIFRVLINEKKKIRVHLNRFLFYLRKIQIMKMKYLIN